MTDSLTDEVLDTGKPVGKHRAGKLAALTFVFVALTGGTAAAGTVHPNSPGNRVHSASPSKPVVSSSAVHSRPAPKPCKPTPSSVKPAPKSPTTPVTGVRTTPAKTPPTPPVPPVQVVSVVKAVPTTSGVSSTAAAPVGSSVPPTSSIGEGISVLPNTGTPYVPEILALGLVVLGVGVPFQVAGMKRRTR